MREKILAVNFNRTPEVICRIAEEEDRYRITISKDNKKRTLWDDKILYPFSLVNDVIVTVHTSQRKFSFKIPEGYRYDAATIPKFLWSVVGSKSDPQYMVASLVHDYLLTPEPMRDIYFNVLKEEISIKEYRRLTTLIFRQLLKDYGTKTVKSNIMAWAVQMWQCTGASGQWNIEK